MMKITKLPTLLLTLSVTLLSVSARPAFASRLHHYIFFDLDRQRIHEATFLRTKAIEGAQLKYTWRELEPKRDIYDFHAIREDLAFLTARHKRLFIQLQDVSFAPEQVLVPRYLQEDPAFHGGANQQYNTEGDDDTRAVAQGWVARRWDEAVRERFQKLLSALGKAFDGKIEGINLPETAVDFGVTGRLYPPGFTPAIYQAAVISNMRALKRAFPRSITLQYANFMPGEWLPYDDHHHLADVYQAARKLGVGVGGPDMQPYKRGQMAHSYPLIRASHGYIPTGVAVQEGNYATVNSQTGQPMTIPEFIGFAQNYLRVDYVFWCTEEPYFSQRLIPFLSGVQSP